MRCEVWVRVKDIIHGRLLYVTLKPDKEVIILYTEQFTSNNVHLFDLYNETKIIGSIKEPW